jgi:two-component system sensor histidine kinase FlrB
VLAQLGDGFFTTKPQGTGLGLAVVRAVARAHGGELEIRSAPGQGTCVSLLLPLHEGSADGGGRDHA